MSSPEQPEILKSPEDLLKKQAEELQDNLGALENLDPGENISEAAVGKLGAIYKFLEKHPDFADLALRIPVTATAWSVGNALYQGNSDYSTLLWGAAAGAGLAGGMKALEKLIEKYKEKNK